MACCTEFTSHKFVISGKTDGFTSMRVFTICMCLQHKKKNTVIDG